MKWLVCLRSSFLEQVTDQRVDERKNRVEMPVAASSKQNKLLTQVVITANQEFRASLLILGVAQSEAMGNSSIASASTEA